MNFFLKKYLQLKQYCDKMHLLLKSRCGGMADATDSKSVICMDVWVQVPSSALYGPPERVVFYYKKLQVPSSSQQNSLKISRQATELKRLVFVRIFLFCPVGSKITYFALAAVACCCAIITGSVGS